MSLASRWSFGGVYLSSFGFVTELDSYLDTIPKRSDNIQIPLVDGRVHTRKYFEQRVMSFGIEIVEDSVGQLEDTLETMRRLFATRTQQLLAYYTQGEKRTSLAEVTGQLGIARGDTPTCAKVAVDFILTDPFFRSIVYAPYLGVSLTSHHIAFDAASKELRCTLACGIFYTGGGELVHVSGSSVPANNAIWTTVSATSHTVVFSAAPTNEAEGATITAKTLDVTPIQRIIKTSPVLFSVYNPGSVDERKAKFTLTGPLSITKIDNTTAGVYLVYQDTIAAGAVVVIDCAAYTATHTAGGVVTNVIGSVLHAGDTSFMTFLPGANAITVTDSAPGTGIVKIEFYPPYM